MTALLSNSFRETHHLSGLARGVIVFKKRLELVPLGRSTGDLAMTTGVMEPESEGEVMYEPFELQPSLLDTVAAVCPEHEAEEIWRVVGPSLVEQAKDLLQEVSKSPFCCFV